MRRMMVVALGFASACGGASNERLQSLEAQVAQLSRGGGSSATADSDRWSAIEQQLAVLQREVANHEPTHGEAPSAVATAPHPAPSTVLDAMTWGAADAALGVDSGGVTVSGDGVVVQRAWLTRELAMMSATPARAPKLVAASGGVIVRLVKPRSLAAQLGLENADVITRIDDHAIVSPADVSRALHASRGGAAKVTLLRKKREVRLDYKLVD